MDYYLVKADALPEVLIKVAEAKKLLSSGKVRTVQEATELLQISRSSFYKYKDSIDSVEKTQMRSATIGCVLQDEPGVLSEVLETISGAQMNVQTIYQTVPTGGLAEISIRVQSDKSGEELEKLLSDIRTVKGVKSAKLLAWEKE